MKNATLFTQEDLEALIAEKLSAEDNKVIPSKYTITFMTDAQGRTSAVVTGVVKDLEGKKPKAKTTGQTAADIMGGEGGVLDRGQALGSGMGSSGRKRRR